MTSFVPHCPLTVCPNQCKMPLLWQCPNGIRGGCCLPMPLLPAKSEAQLLRWNAISSFRQLHELWNIDELRQKRDAYIEKIFERPPKHTQEEIRRANYIRQNLGKASIEETERIVRECCERLQK